MLPKVNLRNMLVLHIFSLFRGITMVIHSVSGGHFVGFFSWQTMLKFSGTEAQVGMAGIFFNIYILYIWKSLYMFFLFSWEPIYISNVSGRKHSGAKRLEWSRGPRIQTWMRTPFYDHNIHDTDNFTVSVNIYITITCIMLNDQYISSLQNSRI